MADDPGPNAMKHPSTQVTVTPIKASPTPTETESGRRPDLATRWAMRATQTVRAVATPTPPISTHRVSPEPQPSQKRTIPAAYTAPSLQNQARGTAATSNTTGTHWDRRSVMVQGQEAEGDNVPRQDQRRKAPSP